MGYLTHEKHGVSLSSIVWAVLANSSNPKVEEFTEPPIYDHVAQKL